MFIIISYDVNTVDKDGKKRLRKLSKELENYAQRVQNSVFEANLDYGTFMSLKSRILKIVDVNNDSIRFYYLGNNWKKKVEHFGKNNCYDSEGFLEF